MDHPASKTEAKAYMNWVNIKLRPLNQKVSDIDGDFKTGVHTNYLAQCLINRPIRFMEKPRSEFQFIQNNNGALEQLRGDGCVLHGTSGSTLYNGNQAMTRGFIWQLMLHYQINRDHPGKSISDARRDALQFINVQLAMLSKEEVMRIRMLTGNLENAEKPLICRSFDPESFSDGTVLAGLCVSINPDDRDDTLKEIERRCNAERVSPTEDNDGSAAVALTHGAITTAENHNEIPILITANDIVNAFEANSVLAYISYYQHAKRQQNDKDDQEKAKNEEKYADLPLFDELAYLLVENTDKFTHKVSFPSAKPTEVSINMPTMQKLQQDCAELDEIIAGFEAFCNKNGPFEPNSAQSLLFSRIKAHRARIQLDIDNYLHGINAIKGIYADLEKEKGQKDELIDQIGVLEAQNDTNNTKITALETQIAALMMEKMTLEAKVVDLEREMRGKDAKIDEMSQNVTKIKDLEQKMEENNVLIESLKANNTHLSGQLANTTSIIIAGESEREGLNGRINELETLIMSLEQQNNQFKMKNDQNQVQIDAFLAKIAALEASNGQLQEKLNEALQKCDGLEMENEKNAQKVTSLGEKVVFLQQALEKQHKQCELDHIGEIASLSANLSHLKDEKNALEGEVEERDADIALKLIEIRSKNDQIGQKNQEIEKKVKEIEILNSEIELIKNQSGNQNDEILKYLDKIKLLEVDITDKNSSNAALLNQLEELQQQLALMKEQLVLVEKENDDNKAQIIVLVKEKGDSEAQKVQLEAKIASNEEELRNLHQKLDEMTKKFEEKCQDYDKLVAEVEVLKQNRDNDQEKIKKLENELEIVKAAQDQSQSDSSAELLALKLAIDAAKGAFEEKEVLLEEKMTILEQKERELSEKNDQIAHLSAKNTELQQENDKLIAQLLDKDADIAKLHQQLEEMEKMKVQMIELTKHLSETQIQIASLQDDATARSHDDNTILADLRKKIDELEAKIAGFEGDKKDKEEKINSLNLDITTKNESIIKKDSEIEQKDDKIQDLEANLSKKDGQVNSLKTQILQLEGQNEVNIVEIDRLNALLVQNEADKKGTEVEIEHLKVILVQNEDGRKNDVDEMGRMIAEIATLRGSLGEKNDEIDQMKGQIDQRDQEIEKLQHELVIIKQNDDKDGDNIAIIGQLTQQKSLADEKVAQLEDKIGQLEQKIKELEEGLKQKDAEISQKTAEINKMNEKVKGLEDVMKKTNEKIKGLEDEVKKMNEKIKTLEEEIAKLKQDIVSQNTIIEQLKTDNDKIKPLQQAGIRMKKEIAMGKEELEKSNEKLKDNEEKMKEKDEKMVELLKQFDLLKKSHLDQKKQLADYKKKKPDGSCGCNCCDHEDHKKKDDGDDLNKVKEAEEMMKKAQESIKRTEELQDDLDTTNSKLSSLKEETAHQRHAHKRELEELHDRNNDLQTENDKLVQNIKNLQEKLKEQGRFDENEDDILTASQRAGAESRKKKCSDAAELLDQLKPQAGVAFASKDPEDGGIKVSKVHLGKAAYIAGVLPGETITTVDGVDVDKEKFSEIWKSDTTKAGSTLLLQVNGVNDRGKRYHRTVKVDLGSNVADVHDVRVLKRMADGHIKQGDDDIYNRVKESQDDYLNGNHINKSIKPYDERDHGNKGYLDENDVVGKGFGATGGVKSTSVVVATTPKKPLPASQPSTTTKPTAQMKSPSGIKSPGAAMRSPSASGVPMKSPTTTNTITSSSAQLKSPTKSATATTTSQIKSPTTTSTPSKMPTTRSSLSTPSKNTLPTPVASSRASFMTPTASSLARSNAMTNQSNSNNLSTNYSNSNNVSTNQSNSNIPHSARSGAITPSFSGPITPRRGTVPPHTPKSPTGLSGVRNVPLSASATARTAPPRGSLGPPVAQSDSRFMANSRSEVGNVTKDYGKYGE